MIFPHVVSVFRLLIPSPKHVGSTFFIQMKVVVWTRLREETSGGKFLALFNLLDDSMIQMGEINVVCVL